MAILNFTMHKFICIIFITMFVSNHRHNINLHRDGFLLSGIITFCTVFGILISSMRERGKVMLDFFVCLNEIVMRMVSLVML